MQGGIEGLIMQREPPCLNPPRSSTEYLYILITSPDIYIFAFFFSYAVFTVCDLIWLIVVYDLVSLSKH